MRHRIWTPVAMALAACGGSTQDIDASDIATGTLAVARLPDEVVLEDEVQATEPTTDAGDLTQGTLDPARLPDEVVTDSDLADVGNLPPTLVTFDDLDDPDNLPSNLVTFDDLDDAGNLPAEVVLQSELPTPEAHGVAGSVVTGTSGSVALTSTAEELLRVTIDSGAVVDVAFTAHVYVEKLATETGRYMFDIRIGSCVGSVVGASLWRPPVSAGVGYAADAITITGFGAALDDDTDVVFCGRKFDAGAADASAYYRGLVAHW